MKSIRYFIAFSCLAALLGQGVAMGKESVVSSPHNLSKSGGRGKIGVAFSEEARICVFCHVPHNAKAAGQLWSRDLPPESTPYQMYGSSTFDLAVIAKPGRPTGASRLCLSCHDGSIALNNYRGSPIAGQTFMPTSPLPTKNPNLTSDLRDDHPISFAYTDAMAGTQGELVAPLALPPQIKLEGGVMLECTGCHDPHNNEFGNFLVMDNKLSGAPLCVACHNNSGWGGSAHNPLNTATLATACMNCHYAHNAPGPVRLLHSKKEEENCYLACHNASAAPSANVSPLFAFGMHRHPVDDAAATGVHDENETLPAQTYHVECVDCHNPHQANGSDAPLSSPPNINGPLSGVRKDTQGNLATKEYEICFKCHSGPQAGEFSGRTETKPHRQIAETDELKRFDDQNSASSHPVMALRRGTGSSLLVPFDSTMQMIYCSDCHNSDQSRKAGGSGPSGPHGSNYEHILIARYDMLPATAPRQTYSASLYDLCFRCHNESYIMGSGSGFVNAGVNEHATHVKGPRGIPCFACHDPHGISLTSVSFIPPSVQNNAHLVNFDMDYASSASVPIPVYTTPAPSSRSGSCKVSCHTSGGSTNSYAP